MKRALVLALLFASGCAGAPQPDLDSGMLAREPAQAAAPLPMRVPIKGVMAGVIDFSAHGVFTTAISASPLTQDDWVAAGLASVNLIGAATLITSPGPGPKDSAWVADPEWRRMARAYQEASIQSAAAIRDRDRAAFLRSANALADACQSCHERFRVIDTRSPTEFADEMQDRRLVAYARAWPAPLP